MKQLRYNKQLDFNEPGDDFDLLAKLLFSGEDHIVCKNIDFEDTELVKKMKDTVDRHYKELFPEKTDTPKLELYVYEDSKCYLVSLIK